MIMSFIMFLMVQTKGSTYNNAFRRSIDATYEGSELKTQANLLMDKAREVAPKPLAIVALPAYGVFVKKEGMLTTSKLSILNSDALSAKYSKDGQGSINLTWRF